MSAPSLTRRERDVLTALCRPLDGQDAFKAPASTRQVAICLGVSEAAIKQHLVNLYDKFELYEGEDHRRVKLANAALATGIITSADLGGVTLDAPSPAAPAAEQRDAAHAAARLRNWQRAYDLLAAAGAAGEPMNAVDWAVLGEAAMWVGEPEASIVARQRAYASHVAAGESRDAAAMALSLVVNNIVRSKIATASGWFAKAKRHLEGLDDGVEFGTLAFTEALFALASGNPGEGLRLAREAFAAGERFGDRDLRALGLVFEAYALNQLGRTTEATPLFDEAMASAVIGDLGPMATGLVYCRTICASLEALDFSRALEWTDAIERAGVDRCCAGFHGDCRVHRASIHVLRGDWAKGESEARIAGAESERFDVGHTGMAAYEVGIVRLRRGDLAGADIAFREAVERGVSPQPGFALLQLARGDRDHACDSIRSAIAAATPGSLQQARLSVAAVEIFHACGATEDVAKAAGDLAGAAETYPTLPLQAAAATARGLAALGADPVAAVSHLRQACRLWLEIGAPYEVARVRVELATALERVGDTTAARMESETAAAAFIRLGAVVDATVARREAI